MCSRITFCNDSPWDHPRRGPRRGRGVDRDRDIRQLEEGLVRQVSRTAQRHPQPRHVRSRVRAARSGAAQPLLHAMGQTPRGLARHFRGRDHRHRRQDPAPQRRRGSRRTRAAPAVRLGARSNQHERYHTEDGNPRIECKRYHHAETSRCGVDLSKVTTQARAGQAGPFDRRAIHWPPCSMQCSVYSCCLRCRWRCSCSS